MRAGIVCVKSQVLTQDAPGHPSVGASLPQGAAEKIKRENDIHLRQLEKKIRTCLLFFYNNNNIFLVRFWAFLGKGTSKTRKLFLVHFQKNHRGEKIEGGNIFSGWKILFLSTSFVALVKRLSVRGTKKT
jgi:hypothetical protein